MPVIGRLRRNDGQPVERPRTPQDVDIALRLAEQFDEQVLAPAFDRQVILVPACHEGFERSKQEAYKRDRSVGMLFKGDDVKEQADVFGADPYPSGLNANRGMLQRGMTQSLSEGLIHKPIDVDSMWHESVRGT